MAFEFKGKTYKTPKHPDLNHIASILDRAKEIVIDTETTGLDWKVDVTVGYVLNWGPTEDEGCYLPIRHGGDVKGKGGKQFGNMEPKKVLGMLREKLPRVDLRWIGHNLPFDLKMMYNDGIHPLKGQPLEDTQINAFVIDERQRSFALDACCKWMEVQEKKGEDLYEYLCSLFHSELKIDKLGPIQLRGMMGEYWRLRGDDPIGVDYALGDGASTWQLWEKQQERLDRKIAVGSREIDLRQAWNVESRLIRPLHRMMMRGIRIDEDRLDQVQKMVDRKLKQQMKKLPKDFSLKGEKKEMAAYFTSHGITDWPLTPAKQEPSFTADWLKTNAPGMVIARARKLEDVTSKFLKPIAERHLFHGRVHASFNQTMNEKFGTRTARLSCNDPNLQAAPKRDEEMSAILRSIFAADKKKKWGDADYNQCEPRLLAHYGNVSALIRGYLSDPPVDAHSAVANSAGIPRQAGKTLNQALITGAGKNEIISQLNMPRRDAINIMDKYFEAMPEIRTFQKRSMAVMQQRGFVCCLMGHLGRTEGDRFDYKAVNKLLQTGNAGVMKHSFARMDEYFEEEGDEVNLLNTVHDSVGIQYPPELEHVYRRGLEIMEDFGPGRSIELAVPLTVDADEGSNWGEATWGVEVMEKVFKEYGEKYVS